MTFSACRLTLPSMSMNLKFDLRPAIGLRSIEADGSGQREQQYCEGRIQKRITVSMFDWNDLKYFLAVAQHGSTLSAAS